MRIELTDDQLRALILLVGPHVAPHSTHPDDREARELLGPVFEQLLTEEIERRAGRPGRFVAEIDVCPECERTGHAVRTSSGDGWWVHGRGCSRWCRNCTHGIEFHPVDGAEPVCLFGWLDFDDCPCEGFEGGGS